jgi:hypothetical protein
LDLLNREYNNFYLRLTHQERKSFAVCVSEHIREYKEGDLLLKEADFVDASVNRLLGYGRQGIKELDLAAFEQAMPDLVRASRESWREAEQKGQSQSPTEKWRWNKTEPLYDRLKLCCSRPSREEKSPRHSGLFARTPTGDRSAEPSTSRKNIISEVELENLSSPPALEPSTEQGREEGQVKEKKYEGGRDEMTENRLLIEGEGASGTLDESSAPTEFRTIPRPSGAVSPSSPGPRLFNPHLSSASANNDSVRVSSTSSFH